MKKGEQIKI